MQVLHIGQGKYLRVITSFADAGEGAIYGMVGSTRVQLSKGSRPFPEIYKCETGYFYKNGAPVDRVEDVAYLPDNYKKEALAFISKEQKAAAPVFEDKVAAVTTPLAQPKKGRGRPKKSAAAVPVKAGKKVIEIKDEASLLSVAGYDKE